MLPESARADTGEQAAALAGDVMALRELIIQVAGGTGLPNSQTHWIDISGLIPASWRDANQIRVPLCCWNVDLAGGAVTSIVRGVMLAPSVSFVDNYGFFEPAFAGALSYHGLVNVPKAAAANTPLWLGVVQTTTSTTAPSLLIRFTVGIDNDRVAQGGTWSQ